MTKTEAFRQWRGRYDLSQEKAARAADVSLGCWRNWEVCEESKGPPAATLLALEGKYPGLVAVLKGALAADAARQDDPS